MRYILLEWKHESEDDPILIYSEVDDANYEIRKIEVYRNGVALRYDENTEFVSNRLSDVSFPENISEINDNEFFAKNIDLELFENKWKEARDVNHTHNI